jgi:hypothetical protein
VAVTRATATITAAVTLLAVAPTASSGAVRVLGHAAFPTSVTAFRGHVVWSSYDAHARRYSLREWYRGRTRTLPVRRRTVAFDVDLGPGPHRAVTAVYSRCKRDGGGNLRGDEGQFGPYTDAKGCDLYRLALASGRERRLHVRGEKTSSEYLPTIWRNRVAFARIFERRKGRRGVYQYLYSADVAGRERPRRLPGGTRGVYRDVSYDSHPVYEGGPGPTALDLRGSRLAFTWTAQIRRCGQNREDYLPLLLSELWLVGIGQQPRRIDHACEGPSLWLATPSFGPRRLFYYDQRSGEGSAWGSHLRAFDIRHAHLSDRRAPYRTVAIARDGTTTYCVRVTILRL